MKGFTLPEQVGCLRVAFGSVGTIVLMLFAFFLLIDFISGVGPSESYAAYLSLLVAFIVATVAGFICFWGLMLRFTGSRQDLRWLGRYFGILGAIVVGIFVSGVVFLGDSYAPAWQLELAVLIAMMAGFLLCWGLATLIGWVIGRFAPPPDNVPEG